MRISIKQYGTYFLIYHDDYDNDFRIPNFLSRLLCHIKMYIYLENPDIDQEDIQEIKKQIEEDYEFIDTNIWPTNDLIVTESDFMNDDNKSWSWASDREVFGDRKDPTSKKEFREIVDKIVQFCENDKSGLTFKYNNKKSKTRTGPMRGDFMSDDEFLLTIELSYKYADMKKDGVMIEELCKENDLDEDQKCVTDLITNECLTDNVVINTNRKPNPYKYCYNNSTVAKLREDPFTREEMTLKRIDDDSLTRMKLKRIAKDLIAYIKPRRKNPFPKNRR